jgi:hypothetical protein
LLTVLVNGLSLRQRAQLEAAHVNMFDWQDFDALAVFRQKPDFFFDNKTVESILKHRKEFGHQLSFDRMWKSMA